MEICFWKGYFSCCFCIWHMSKKHRDKDWKYEILPVVWNKCKDCAKFVLQKHQIFQSLLMTHPPTLLSGSLHYLFNKFSLLFSNKYILLSGRWHICLINTVYSLKQIHFALLQPAYLSQKNKEERMENAMPCHGYKVALNIISYASSSTLHPRQWVSHSFELA